MARYATEAYADAADTLDRRIDSLSLNDDFSTDSSANYTAHVGGISISGGSLKPTAANTEFVHNIVNRRELLMQAKFITGAVAPANGSYMSLILAYVDANNYLTADFQLSNGVGNAQIGISRKVAGVLTAMTTVSVGAATAVPAGATRWLRGRVSGETAFVGVYSSDPEVAGNTPLKTQFISININDAVRHMFGPLSQGIKYGVRLVGVELDSQVDDLKIWGS